MDFDYSDSGQYWTAGDSVDGGEGGKEEFRRRLEEAALHLTRLAAFPHTTVVYKLMDKLQVPLKCSYSVCFLPF